jgi:NAD(P)-dependent dehydrogenase (short-subunit alcohol dehydrogenase family)
MAINLKGPYFLTQLIAKWMIELRKELQEKYQPYIINISSLSRFAVSRNRGEYCISKAGMTMLTKLFADRLSDYEIPVFEISPGIIDTPMTEKVHEKYDKLINEGLTPINRWGAPIDIAKPIVAIVSGLLPFSTGIVIDIDGGFHIQRL